MAQLALYLDDETAKRIDQAARRRSMSRSAWVRNVILKQLDDKLPESFFEVLGSWEDGRDPDEILKDIRAGSRQAERPEIE
ncbi:MAG TPA: CopG family transcriptional regulator [Myxococcota bacterium]|nr:CopG family transcriptional regulator [Myxococcota bacterium]